MEISRLCPAVGDPARTLAGAVSHINAIVLDLPPAKGRDLAAHVVSGDRFKL